MYLEVKNLKKAYKIKKADPVMALDGVSLTFPEKGLVFILGKSGSGKSTLLNVMGGLDTADSGEIIINGKSSKDFESSELDSYRNTYLGFIFQEYNILNDFTVRDNIALALELQHKKADDEAINNILQEVDLTGFAKRKPNELSGGQKQRVAIARALVKDPKILFADEPTGALDSATGLAVFETLKKLSETRLVVVVSHDRDFAERFGDRVIELKDGQVISDITKIEEDVVNETGISIYGTNLIKIEKGHKLTQDDIDLINDKLASSDTDAYFSIDTRINDSVNSAAMINEKGKKESFIQTADDTSLKEGRDMGKWKVVKSKFPANSAFKMGAKSLRVKPFRLVLTILISFVAFAMFGLAVSFARINRVATTANSMGKSNETSIAIYANGSTSSSFGDYRKDELEKKTGIKFDPIVSLNSSLDTPVSIKKYNYYIQNLNGVMYLDLDNNNRYDFSISCGKYPTQMGEVAITLDAYYTYEEYGIRCSKTGIVVSSEDITKEKVIGKYISTWSYDGTESGFYKIVGIIDNKIDLSKFDSLKNSGSGYSQEMYQLENELRNLRNARLSNVFFVNQKQFNTLSSHSYTYFDGNPWIGFQYIGWDGYEINSAIGFSLSYDDALFFNPLQTTVGDNEVLISFDTYNYYLKNIMNQKVEEEIDYSEEFVFPDVLTYVNAEKQLTTPLVINNSWNSIWYNNNQEFETITKYLYLKDYYKGEKKDPRLANLIYSHYDISALDYMLEKDGSEYATEVIGGDTYYIINWDGVAEYYEYDHGVYNTIINLFVENVGISVPDYLIGCKENMEAAKTSAYNMLRNIVFKAYPNAYIERLITSYGLMNYSQEETDYFYNNYKTSTLKDIFENDTGNTLSEWNKSEFINWYLQLFVDNNPEASEVDSTYFNQYKQERLNKIKSSMENGDLPSEVINTTMKQYKWLGDYDSEKDINKKIVGLYFGTTNREFSFYMNKNEILEINPDASGAQYSMLVTPMPNYEQLSKLLDYYFDLRDKSMEGNSQFYLSISSSTLESIEIWVDLISDLYTIFLYTGLGAALFSMLLFYNFISISINNKRHEIGVLRAVGARGTDVFKIFYSESLIIGLINFVLAILAVFGVTIALNIKIGEAIAGLVLLNTGIVEVLAVLGLALFASFLSALLPVVRLSKQKPIDAIREK